MLNLNKKEKNRIVYSVPINTTSYTGIFRLKKNIEDTTVPLVEVNATKLTNSTTSTGYFDVNLENTDYSGYYYYQIELTDGVNPSIFFNDDDKPAKCYIGTTLKQHV